MATKKSSSKKKSVKKRTINKPNTKPQIDVDKILLQNFVSLQKVMVNLSTKFDELSTQISQLLNLFELSAKTLVTKNFNLTGREENKELIKKIDNLLDQNKTIARGLTLMYEGTVNRGMAQNEHHSPAPSFQEGHMPQAQMQPSSQSKPLGRDGNYQKSISAREE